MPLSPAPSRLRVPLSGSQAVSETSAMVWRPRTDRDGCGVVLGHGAGTDMTNPLVRAVADGLSAHGHPVVAFNFAYTEAGRRAPDRMPRLESCYRDVVTVATDVLDGRPIVLGGRSMGGRVATHLAAAGDPCAGLVLLGYPLHPARRAGAEVPDERLRSQHWPGIHVPMLFVQGDRDRLCDLSLLQRERSRLPDSTPHELHVVEGGDHGFGVRKSDGRSEQDVVAEVVDTVAGWLRRRAAPDPPASPRPRRRDPRLRDGPGG